MKFVSLFLFVSTLAIAAPKVGDPAPTFEIRNQDNQLFKLSDRKGKGWTVLYFYPKASTPGCTKQACTFRDSIEEIRKQKAEVYGISSDTVEDQAKFHKEQKLKFALLADPTLEVINKYDVKMPAVPYAKRTTFLIDPNLVIRNIDENVDPTADPKNVAEKLKALQK